ncbi:MAG: hypothetical protein C4521_09180 [Actinobacteria bacterium]|nr:MAG: hypothetical protein C4521_09180 [Actinomycetota bacterium]
MRVNNEQSVALETASTAFVLGLFDTGLSIVRSLARAGIEVVGFGPDPREIGFKSRFCRAIGSPHPVEEPRRFLELLLTEAEKRRTPPILFPSGDPTFWFTSRYREELAERFLFIVPPPPAAEAGLNKRVQYEMASRAGIACPDTYYPASRDELADIVGEIECPAMVKPYFSHLWQMRIPGSKGRVAGTPEEILASFDEAERAGLQVMIQSLIPGPNTAIVVLSAYIGRNGKPLALFTHRKVRQWDPTIGSATLVRSERIPGLVETGLSLLEAIGYRGQCAVEFKQDARDGTLKLIEINPRFVQQNYLATRCGVNFPLIQYMDLTGQEPQPRTSFDEGVKWLDAIPDAMAFFYHHQRGELTFPAWLMSLRGSRAFPKFAWDDPLPFVYAYTWKGKLLKGPLWLWSHRRHPDSGVA